MFCKDLFTNHNLNYTCLLDYDSYICRMKYSQLPSSETNPFEDKLLEVFRFGIGSQKSTDLKKVVDDDGVLYEMKEIGNFVVKGYDPQKFVKVYQGFGNITKGLSSAAERVLRFIMDNLIQDSDEVIVNITVCMQFCGYKANILIYKGLTELCERKIIAKKAFTDNTFFINSTFIFNGSRMKLRAYSVARNNFVRANRAKLVSPSSEQIILKETEEIYGGKTIENIVTVTNDEQAEYVPEFKMPDIPAPASEQDWFEQMKKLTGDL